MLEFKFACELLSHGETTVQPVTTLSCYYSCYRAVEFNLACQVLQLVLLMGYRVRSWGQDQSFIQTTGQTICDDVQNKFSPKKFSSKTLAEHITADLSSNNVRPQNMRWESSFTMRFCDETQERHQLPHKFEPDKCGRIRPKNCRRGSCMNPQNWKLGIDVQSTNIKTEEVTAYKTWLPPTTRTARHQGCHQHLRHHLPNDDISKAQLDFLMAQDYKTQLWDELTLLWWLINLYPYTPSYPAH